jgi:hypothetical protein
MLYYSNHKHTHHDVVYGMKRLEKVNEARSALSIVACLLASSSVTTATRRVGAVKDGCLFAHRTAYVENEYRCYVQLMVCGRV